MTRIFPECGDGPAVMDEDYSMRMIASAMHDDELPSWRLFFHHLQKHAHAFGTREHRARALRSAGVGDMEPT